MIFKNNVVLLGKGRILSARNIDGVVNFALKEDGCITLKLMSVGSKQISYATPKIISYANDCILLNNGIVERSEKVTYVAKK